jgi:hypothetical protein
MLDSSSGGSSPASPLPKSPSKDGSDAGASGARRTELIWRQLPLHEPLLDQLIMRWELTARREFGASPAVPPGAFELVIRKIYSNGSRGSTNVFEAELEMAQARSDLLDGRLTRALRPDELLDLACVLALREMHVRPLRRPGHLQSASRGGKTPPTIEFDLKAKELCTVLPPDLLMEQFGAQESSAGGGGWNRGGSTGGRLTGTLINPSAAAAAWTYSAASVATASASGTSNACLNDSASATRYCSSSRWTSGRTAC